MISMHQICVRHMSEKPLPKVLHFVAVEIISPRERLNLECAHMAPVQFEDAIKFLRIGRSFRHKWTVLA